MLIRPAGPPDLAALLRLGKVYATADGAGWDESRARAGFEPLLTLAKDRQPVEATIESVTDVPSSAHGVVLVVDVAATVVGYAVLTWGWSIEAGGREALLDEVFIEHPGHGYGTALIDAVMRHAAQHGASRVFLETEAANEAARAFWVRRGFDVEDSVWLQRPCIREV